MAGTAAGGVKATKVIYAKYGKDYYKHIGRKGGSVLGIKKGFALLTAEQRSEYGKRGGEISRRPAKV